MFVNPLVRFWQNEIIYYCQIYLYSYVILIHHKYRAKLDYNQNYIPNPRKYIHQNNNENSILKFSNSFVKSFDDFQLDFPYAGKFYNICLAIHPFGVRLPVPHKDVVMGKNLLTFVVFLFHSYHL